MTFYVLQRTIPSKFAGQDSICFHFLTIQYTKYKSCKIEKRIQAGKIEKLPLIYYSKTRWENEGNFDLIKQPETVSLTCITFQPDSLFYQDDYFLCNIHIHFP